LVDVEPLTVKPTALLETAVEAEVTVIATDPEAFAEMTNAAVICVALSTVRLPTVTPGLLDVTKASEAKFAPLIVTFTVVPGPPVFGFSEVMAGAVADAAIMNGNAAVVPAEVVTVTFTDPEVLAPTVKVAVICVALTTVTLLTATNELFTFTVAPETKLVPVSVTVPLLPATPPLGLRDVRVGVSGFRPKVTGLVVPPELVTVTLIVPVALAAIANVAVI